MAVATQTKILFLRTDNCVGPMIERNNCRHFNRKSHAAFPANGRSITEVDALPAESFLSIQLMISNGLFEDIQESV